MGSEFQKSKSGFGINTSKIPCVSIFDLNLGKLPNYVQYFGSNIVEDVAESWVEVSGAGWRWMEVGGGWWSWVHGLVIPEKNVSYKFSTLNRFTRT